MPVPEYESSPTEVNDFFLKQLDWGHPSLLNLQKAAIWNKKGRRNFFPRRLIWEYQKPEFPSWSRHNLHETMWGTK